MGSVKTEEKIAVMQAEVDGKKIQIKSSNGADWISTNQPLTWDWWSYDYRVKPEPREIYCNEYKTGFGSAFGSTDEADRHVAPGRTRVVRFVEDMEYKED